MAGIYDRVAPGRDRIPIHFIKAAVYLQVRGVFTTAQIRDGINSLLETPLDAQAETDLLNICTQAAAGTAAAKLDYLERLDALNLITENSFITENVYRTQLGIP
jgi:hypothetical protein